MKKIKVLKKMLTFSGWGSFLQTFNRKERIVFFALVALFLISALFSSLGFYFRKTELLPTQGGIYKEGVIGSLRFINPIYAASSDVDRDLTELIYSGLMKYDEKGEIVNDLAKKHVVSDNGSAYEFYLKENIFWQDGQPITADDVIFTVKTIQNPSFKSPLRANWLGVKAEKISESAVRFELSGPSGIFLENSTLKILPKHIWQDISPQNFSLSIYNLKPVGSGPYKFKGLIQNKDGSIQSFELVNNPYYADKKPFISQIVFYFFQNEESLIKSFNSGEINGFSLVSLDKYQSLKKNRLFEYHFSLPRYFAIFFNLEKSKILSDKKIRDALNYGTNKAEIVQKALSGQGKISDSPVLPDIYGFDKPEKIYEFNPEKAKQLLDDAGFSPQEDGILVKTINKTPSFQFKSDLKLGSKGTEVRELQNCLVQDPAIYPDGKITGTFDKATKEAVIKFQEKYREDILVPAGLKNGNGEVLKSTRKKLNEICTANPAQTTRLSFSLTTVDQPVLKKVASILKEQWQKIGVELEIKTFDISALEEEVIRPRNYDMLLFGEMLGAIPDPYPFWHSSQIKDPGLNLTAYENKKYDKLLEEARQAGTQEERRASLEAFQNILINDSPAVFLYNPDYLYFISKEIKGINSGTIIDPSKRFSGVTGWYVKTQRAWK